MFALDPHTEEQFIRGSLLVGKLEFLFLPTKGHFGEADNCFENLHLDHIVVSVLEPQRFAVVVFVVVRIAPSVAVHQVASVLNILVVIELEFILLDCSSVHHAH